MIDIYKASAGSGKTFTLSKTYREFLLKAGTDDAYRHILAVTFTNKATEEMKDRILRDLSEGDEKSRKILIRLLHDYGSFAVSTIDRFFQQALRAFARELGHAGNYQIELDKDSLMTEALDRIMDDLTADNTTLLNWFNKEISAQLSEGNKPSIESSLHDMARLFGKAVDIYGKDGLRISRDEIATLQKECSDIIVKYVGEVNGKSREIELIPKNVKRYSTVIKAVEKLQNWKGKDEKDILLGTTSIEQLTANGYGNVVELVNPAGSAFKEYKTAQTILKTTFVLGISQEFFEKLKELEEEKNVLCLDQTTALLRDIIDGSDAPFVYEKLGVRYNNFLLDEFQDTSETQWDNFKPLLDNSASQGHDNIIVGDVKQSIYRFRGSDWKLLDSKIGEEFPDNTKTHNLQNNWRSCKAIVDFNNDFFVKAANYLKKDKLYSDVKQNVKKTDFEGCVTIDFCPKKQEILDTTLNYVEEALKDGARPCDIAILVRAKAEGSEIANMLIDHNYGVVSDDSLLLNSSAVVRQAISVLQAISDPGNSLETYIRDNLNIDIDKNYHSILDLCDRIFMALKASTPDIFNGQTLFVQSFMDVVLNWTGIYGNNLQAFLKYWDENIDSLLINSPEDADSIRITTVHKSKGLAYPVVIFPFAEKVNIFKEDEHWSKLDKGQFLGGKYDDWAFPVSLGKSLNNSYFSQALQKEVELQEVDNLNIFYVCLTRAEYQMHIIAKEPSQVFKDSGPATHITDILYNTHQNIRLGESCNFAEIRKLEAQKETAKKQTPAPVEFEAGYDSFPMNIKGEKPRLKASEQAWDFFSTEGIGNSRRMDGIRLHNILSRIRNMNDMERVLQYQDSSTAALLETRIREQAQWFAPELKVFNETPLLTAKGETLRPDRVTIDESGRVNVIDFKFGDDEKEYHTQVEKYKKQYRDLGYKDVRGYLWFVRDNRVMEI